MIQVVPAIIPESFDDLVEQTSLVKDFVDIVQVDIMDGKFAPTKSWPYNKKKDKHFEELVRGKGGFEFWQDLNFEVDMMIERPEEHAYDWICAGASALIIHIGSTNNIQSILDIAEEKHIGVGLALRPETPNEMLLEWLPHINFVQFMGNQKIGYHGVELDMKVLDKIKDLRSEHPELIIGVDIGVTLETAPLLVDAGANKLVSGSTIFKSDNIQRTIEDLTHIGE